MTLSDKDSHILALIFGSDVEANAAAPPSREAYDASTVNAIKKRELQIVQCIEEKGDTNLEEKLQQITELVNEFPRYASAYTNRAQILRLLRDLDHALADCDTAIKLANEDKVVLRQSYSTKATILYSQGREGESSAAFEKAGQYGWEVGKAMSLKTNAYAKMCGKVVSSMLSDNRVIDV